ncbi:hypothetical protein B0J18DRAFT_426629 [Chaetomium sp. MPI-SDFR-AT-0129]|nr:hypothetical protein B0J18DRAFT_426629 [Chaetomium sp. MPI-SDFR-AT-0129]
MRAVGLLHGLNIIFVISPATTSLPASTSGKLVTSQEQGDESPLSKKEIDAFYEQPKPNQSKTKRKIHPTVDVPRAQQQQTSPYPRAA